MEVFDSEPYNLLLDVLLTCTTPEEVARQLEFNQPVLKMHPLLDENLLEILRARPTPNEAAVSKAYWLHDILMGFLTYDWTSDLLEMPIMKMVVESQTKGLRRLPRWLREPSEQKARQYLERGKTLLNEESGDRAIQIEKAIMDFVISLEIFKIEEYPIEFAVAQGLLGRAYQERIRGERANNLELSIAAFEKSKLVFVQDKYPEGWAETQLYLGNSYRERLRGDKVNNIKLAIELYDNVLEFYTKETHASNWAMVQSSLGFTYMDKLDKNKSINIEKAIIFFKSALEIYTKENNPKHWANAQNSLGIAY